jgi:LDH2 family malate/lactate/ureidoglycolate dehydrogenase
MRDGKLNPKPRVQTVQETTVSLIVDGDGGLGYFPSHDGATELVRKAAGAGIAILLTRNHGHFGAAGLYVRQATQAGLCAFVTSGHQLTLKPGDSHFKAAGGSPMAFGAPAADEPDLILDFGTMHDLYAGSPHRDDLSKLAPGLVLRSLGMGTVCQVWGGLLSGLSMHPDKRPWSHEGANQGGLFIFFRPDLFRDEAQFRAEVDTYSRMVRGLSPIPSADAAYLPGGIEALREREYKKDGVPVSDEHRELLEGLASELKIEVPWANP